METLSVCLQVLATAGVRALRARQIEPIPQQGSALAAGFDLVAAIENELCLAPNARVKVPCGFSMALPCGYEAQVRPRSGLAIKHGVTVLNAPGTIDADYRGEVAVLLINFGQEDFRIDPGMRIAQLVVAQVPQVRFECVATLEPSVRGEAGFGSTGLL